MGQHTTIGRTTFGAASLQHRAVEPAAVLVGTLEVQVRDAIGGPVGTVTQHEGVGRTGVEPHVKDVEHLLVVVRVHHIAKEALFRALFVPRIRAFGLKGFVDTRVDLFVAEQEVFVLRLRADFGKAGQRDAPSALAGQNPIRACFDHRIQAVAACLRGPFYQLVDAGQSAITDGFAVGVLTVANLAINRREPLGRVAVDDRRFGTPRVRVAVLHTATGDDPAGLDQLGDDSGVGFALFALAIKDLKTGKERHVVQEFGFLAHVIGHALDPVAGDKDFVVLLAVAGGGVDEPCTCVVGHVITIDHGHVVVPEAVGSVDAVKRVGTDKTFEFAGGDVANLGEFCHAGFFQRISSQSVGEKVQIAGVGPAFLLGRVHAVEAVFDAVAVSDRFVRWDGPRGGGPDHDARSLQIAASVLEAEGHPDRVALVIVVLDLCLGQRGFFHGRPHHGLGALIQSAGHQEFLEFFGDHTLGVEVHGQIGIIPRAGDAQTLEFFALDVDPALGEFAAFLTEVDDGNFVFVLALLAVLFLDLPFDGQTVAVPTGDIARLAAQHLLAADDKILEDLVQGVTDVQVTVRIRGAIVQDKGLATLGLVTQLLVDVHFLPAGQPFGLSLGQTGPHGEVGLGQEQGVFVVGRFGAHVWRPSVMFYV